METKIFPIVILVLLATFIKCSPTINSYSNPAYYSQSNSTFSQPFQVVYSRNVVSSLGNEVAELELIDRSERLTVAHGGHLIIMHFTGELLEFQEGCEVIISEKARELSLLYNLEEGKNKRFDLPSFLYPDHPKAQQWICQPSMLVSAGHIANVSGKSLDVCFWLLDVPKIEGEFFLQVKNIFDQAVDTVILSSKTEHFLLNFDNYPTAEGLIILNFNYRYNQGTNNATEHLLDVGVKIDARPYFIPKKCEPENALEALQIAFYLEWIGWKEVALPYYQMAAHMSDEPAYKYLRNLLFHQSSRSSLNQAGIRE